MPLEFQASNIDLMPFHCLLIFAGEMMLAFERCISIASLRF